jgi:hypothetical protein
MWRTDEDKHECGESERESRNPETKHRNKDLKTLLSIKEAPKVVVHRNRAHYTDIAVLCYELEV